MLTLAQVWYKKGSISKKQLGIQLAERGVSYESCTDMGDYYCFSIEPIYADNAVIIPIDTAFVVLKQDEHDDKRKRSDKVDLDLKKIIFGDE